MTHPNQQMRNLLLVLRLVRQHLDRFEDRERYKRRLAELNSTALSDFAFSVVVARVVPEIGRDGVCRNEEFLLPVGGRHSGSTSDSAAYQSEKAAPPVLSVAQHATA